jgi:hypothetical protein|tara:strand:+ start:1113 stop:1484 length:372 start_codon:yes stop_codon:yes gene_type:complete
MEAALLAFKLNKLRDFFHILNKIINKNSTSQTQADQVDSVIKDMRKFEDLTKSDFQVPSSIDDNKALLKKIVERLLKQDKARLIEIVRNLNAKYEYAHLAQYLMRVILPDFDAPLYVEHFKKL